MQLCCRFVIALTGCLLVAMMSRGRVALLAAVTVVAIAGVGITVSAALGLRNADEQSTCRDQGNVPQPRLISWAADAGAGQPCTRTTDELASAQLPRGGPQPDALIWPENSSDIDPVVSGPAGAAVSSAARSIGVPILVGTVQEVPGRRPGGQRRPGLGIR